MKAEYDAMAAQKAKLKKAYQAAERFDLLVEQMTKQEGVTEQLKARNQMLWVQKMNSARARAEELVKEEIIYCL